MVVEAWSREKLPEVRAEMIRFLFGKSENARAAFKDAARDKDARVRVAAFEGLATLKEDKEAEDLFREAFSNDKEAYGVRAAALRTLVAWKVKDAPSLVVKGLEARSFRDDLAAVALDLALKQPGPEARGLAFASVKKGKSLRFRQRALTYLAQSSKEDQEIQNELISLIDDPNRIIRLEVWRVLADSGVNCAVSLLEKRLASEEEVAVPRLKAAIEKLKEAVLATAPPEAGPKPANGNKDVEDADLSELAKLLNDGSAELVKIREETSKIKARLDALSERDAAILKRFEKLRTDKP